MDDTVNLETKIQFVKKQACFLKLTEQEKSELGALLKEKKFQAGETIVTEGDSVDSFFLIIKGTADVRYILIDNGKQHAQSIATLGPGDAIGLNESGFFSLTGLRTATVVALTDMVTLRLSIAEFHGFSLANHHVSEVMRAQAKNIIET